ncbi:MAG: DinB family protein [Anaerolineae bacterium]|nr:DinB family protein [Anaerolineae bacterium]
MQKSEWTHSLIPLLALALRLEGEGQYNLAKLARATADALGRRAAYQALLSTERQGAVEEIQGVTEALSGLELGEELLAAFQRGTNALAEGRIPSIIETPHPYVCRTCGHIVLGEVTQKCPSCGAWQDTFQWFAPIYWLEALDPPAALEKLRQTPLEVAAILEGLSEETMTQEPQDGGWAIRNVITHMRDAQDVLDYRLELFAKEEHPILEAKAVWSWAKNEEEHPPSTMDLFAEYQATRSKILARLVDLPLADWWRTGQHGEFGEVSIKQQVSYFAAHELTHLPQIERLRKILLT